MSEETIIVLDLSNLSRDREPGVWTGEVEAALGPVCHLRRPHAGLHALLVAPDNLGSAQLPFTRVSSSLQFKLSDMIHDQTLLSHLLCRLVLFAENKVMESEFRWSCHGLQFPLAVVAGLRVSLDGVTPKRQRGELLPRVLSPSRD